MISEYFVYLAFLATIVASDKLQSCPSDTNGIFPNCICQNGAIYDATYNWCPTQLTDLKGVCPDEAPGYYPNCRCELGRHFDKERRICTVVNRSGCPAKSTGVPPNCKCEDKYVFDEIHWYCRPWYLETTTEHIIRNYTTPVYKPSCGAFQDGIYPNCHWRPCPSHSLNSQDHYPYCRFNITYIRTPVCPDGLRGTPPNCYKPCPANYYGTYPDCKRIKCQTGRGWTGEFQPDCKFTPRCPDGFPGVFPFCDIYAAKPTPTYLPPVIRIPTTQPPTYLPPTERTITTKKPVTLPPTYLPPITRTTTKPTKPRTPEPQCSCPCSCSSPAAKYLYNRL